MGGGEEAAARELIPRPAVKHPARPALADPAHPDGIRTSWYFHPIPALAAAVDEMDPATIVTISLRSKRAPLLEEVRHARVLALIAKRPSPVRMHRTSPRPGLTTRDHPLQAASQREFARGSVKPATYAGRRLWRRLSLRRTRKVGCHDREYRGLRAYQLGRDESFEAVPARVWSHSRDFWPG